MTHNFVTTKYQEVDGIIVNSDPKRFCVLSTPPDFKTKNEFANFIENICTQLIQKKVRILHTKALNKICIFFCNGHILFPFNNLYSSTNAVISKIPKDLLILHKEIADQISPHYNGQNRHDKTRISGLIINILLCSNQIKSIDSFSPSLLKICFSKVILDKAFVAGYMC